VVKPDLGWVIDMKPTYSPAIFFALMVVASSSLEAEPPQELRRWLESPQR
jgi:hypothetical protein